MSKHAQACALSSLLVFALGHARPAYADARLAWQHGMAEFTLEHWDSAIASFEMGFAEDPRPEFLYNIASAHHHAGRRAEAIRFYRKYLDLAPTSENVEAVRKEIERLQNQPASTEVLLAVPAPPPRRHRVAIAVGVSAGVVVIALGLGLGLGLRTHFSPNAKDIGPGAQ
jgi:tetratricopeptide (TPR) repeat protein